MKAIDFTRKFKDEDDDGENILVINVNITRKNNGFEVQYVYEDESEETFVYVSKRDDKELISNLEDRLLI